MGGAFGRRHMNAALNAAGAMLESANQADSVNYDRAYKQWKDHLDLGLKAIDMMNRETNEIIAEAGHNYDRASANLQTLATLYSLPGKYDHEEVQRQKDQLDLIKSRQDIIKQQNTDSEIRLAIQEKDEAWLKQHPEAHGVVPTAVSVQHHGEAERDYKGTALGRAGESKEISQVAPDGTVRRGVAYRVGTDWYWAGTDEPVIGEFNFESTARPRSAPAEYIDALRRENPNISAAEVSHAAALFKADAAFASGVEGRSVNSLNTLADHLPLFEKYAKALETHDIPRINQALQTLSRETGHPEITNYQIAQEFIADEAVREMVPGGAGALADREAMKTNLKASMAQAQFAGAADVIKDFVHGKLGALRQQYSRGDAKLVDYFNEHILTPDARQLFDTAAAPQGIPVPAEQAGDPDGKRYQGSDGKVYIKRGNQMVPQ